MSTTGPFQRILIAIDVDELARDTLAAGAVLAERLGARFEVVHAVEVPPTLWPGIDEAKLAEMHASALASARPRARETVEAALRGSAFAGRPTDDLLTVAPGHPATVILRAAERGAADLVLLGPHEKRSLFDFGSTARAVLSEATTPLWMQVGAPSAIERVLVAVDFSEHSRRALDVALALAERLDAEVRVLHCYSPPDAVTAGTMDPVPVEVLEAGRDAAREQLERWVRDVARGPLRIAPRFVDGDARATIPEEAEDCGLIVVGTHGRTGLSRFLLGSVAHGVLKSAGRPVLVVPDPGRAWLLPSAPSEGAVGSPGARG